VEYPRIAASVLHQPALCAVNQSGLRIPGSALRVIALSQKSGMIIDVQICSERHCRF
jgi:hypothetical protein